jgi:hypothetical protein
MANTTATDGKTINILFDGATDWSWDSATEIAAAPTLVDMIKGGRVYIKSISFRPSATNDVCIIRSRSLTGLKIFDVICANVYDIKTVDIEDWVQGIYATGADVVGTGSVIIRLG